MGGGGKKDSPKVPVVDYYMSVHFALCHGPIDGIWRIVVKEKEAWRGFKAAGAFSVHAPGLFGGNKKEGGVGGVVEVFPGSLDQKMSVNVASRFRRTPDTMPAYRGVATVFFSSGVAQGYVGGQKLDIALGGRYPPLSSGLYNVPGFPLSNASYAFSDIPLDRTGGFYWASNNPYLPETWIKASRAPRGPLPGALASVSNLVPEAIIGLADVDEDNDGVPDYEEDDDDSEDDDDTPPVPDAENEDPLNGYYIGALPTEQNFIKTTFGYQGTPQSINDDPVFERRLFDLANRDKLQIGGLVYRNYGDDANPAHLIMECMMDTVWGMSAPETMFDIPRFTKAAQGLWNEKFGLSLSWQQQSTIEAMVSEILDHIQATLYLSPRTGLFTLDLLRGDYDYDTLRELNPDNATIRSFQRKAWGETINEVVVTWTNPENEKDSTVTMQDLANISIQGGIVSENRNYYGIRNAALAMKVAARDLRSASAPLATFEAELDRRAWDIVPGEVIKVIWPDEGIDGAVYRIMDVDYGRIGASTIKVKFMEDVFALPTQGYRVLGPAVPVNQDGKVSPLDDVLVMTTPPQLASRAGATEANVAYPDAAVMIFGASENTLVESFELFAPGVATNGVVVDESLGVKNLTTHCLLPLGLPLEFTSVINAFSAATRAGGEPAAGGLFVIGTSEEEHEIAMFDGWTENVGYTIRRGMLDTVPRAWPANTPAWVFQFGYFNAIDPRRRAATLPVTYEIQTATPSEKLAEDALQVVEFTPSDRLWLPTRPANCKLNGQPLRLEIAGTPPATIAASWSNRNRTLEDTVFQKWDAANVMPEDGQTTTIRVYSESGDLDAEFEGLTGTAFDLPLADLEGGEQTVRFFAVNSDGLESLQAFAIALKLPYVGGYGNSYGGVYGE